MKKLLKVAAMLSVLVLLCIKGRDLMTYLFPSLNPSGGTPLYTDDPVDAQ